MQDREATIRSSHPCPASNEKLHRDGDRKSVGGQEFIEGGKQPVKIAQLYTDSIPWIIPYAMAGHLTRIIEFADLIIGYHIFTPPQLSESQCLQCTEAGIQNQCLGNQVRRE